MMNSENYNIDVLGLGKKFDGHDYPRIMDERGKRLEINTVLDETKNKPNHFLIWLVFLLVHYQHCYKLG